MFITTLIYISEHLETGQISINREVIETTVTLCTREGGRAIKIVT